MLKSIQAARAKRIRRLNEDCTARSLYLATENDSYERQMLAALLRRNERRLRELQAERAALLEAWERNEFEDRYHRENVGDLRAINGELAACEGPEDTAQPPENTAVALMSGC